MAPDIAIGAAEWLQVPASIKPVLKSGDIKFYRCPLSVITPRSWQLIALVNDCITADGDIIRLPADFGDPLPIPLFREIVKMVRAERASWRREQQERRTNG